MTLWEIAMSIWACCLVFLLGWGLFLLGPQLYEMTSDAIWRWRQIFNRE